MIRILFLIAFLAPIIAQAQTGPDYEPPLPLLKGVTKVIKRNISLEQERLYGPKPTSDTNDVWLIDKDGRVHTEYSYTLGTWNSKRTYEYRDGNLIRKNVFENKNRGDYLKALNEDSMELKNRKELDYKDNRAVVERYYCCKASPGLTQETFFTYDKQGRIILKVNKRYTIPGGLYWGSQKNDSTLYRHQNDTVYATRYESTGPAEQFRFYEKRDAAGHLLISDERSPDGAHFERATYVYDKKSRLQESEYHSDRQAVQPDGIVLRADKVTYAYDDKGRLLEETYYALGKARWKYFYIYIP